MPKVGSYFDSPPIVPPSGQIPEEDLSAIQKAKRQLFVDTAEGIYLTNLGQNFGVPRPPMDPDDDDLYRLVIQAIAFQPKTILCTLYSLMSAVFGPQSKYTTLSQRPWRIYEVNDNEFIVEVPFDLLGTSNDTASYLHGFSGVVLSGATTTAFSCRGNAKLSAVSLVGLGASILISGTYEEQAIATAIYDPTTDTTSFTTAAFSGAPDPGASFFITVPGDEVSSFRGDYLSPTWYERGTATAVSSDSLTDSGLSMTTNQYVGYYLRLANGRIFYPITANDATSFTLDAQGRTPPSGFYAVVKTPFDADEESDTPTTPPHADRVFVTGLGLLEVAKFYIDLLLHAADVTVRYETV